MNEDQYAEIHAQLAANEAEHREMKRRLDNHADAIKEQNKMLVQMERQANAIERMGRAIDRLEETVVSVGARVGAIEKEPGEKWKKTSWEILKYVILALVGLAVGWALKTPAP